MGFSKNIAFGLCALAAGASSAAIGSRDGGASWYAADYTYGCSPGGCSASFRLMSARDYLPGAPAFDVKCAPVYSQQQWVPCTSLSDGKLPETSQVFVIWTAGPNRDLQYLGASHVYKPLGDSTWRNATSWVVQTPGDPKVPASFDFDSIFAEVVPAPTPAPTVVTTTPAITSASTPATSAEAEAESSAASESEGPQESEETGDSEAAGESDEKTEQDDKTGEDDTTGEQDKTGEDEKTEEDDKTGEDGKLEDSEEESETGDKTDEDKTGEDKTGEDKTGEEETASESASDEPLPTATTFEVLAQPPATDVNKRAVTTFAVEVLPLASTTTAVAAAKVTISIDSAVQSVLRASATSVLESLPKVTIHAFDPHTGQGNGA